MEVEPKVIKVNLKWGSEKYNDIPIEITSPVPKFRNFVYELTTVPIQKQKIIFKGQTIKDETNLLNLNLQNGSLLMLMGQAEGNQLQQTDKKTIFIEDLTPEQKAKILKDKEGIILPIGLVNLGNTCYLNSSIQCMKRINELKDYLQKTRTEGHSPNHVLFKAMQSIMNQLEAKGEGFKPLGFIQIFMQLFPQFSEREDSGAFKQQDADECFQNILALLDPIATYENDQGEQRKLLRDLFEIKFEVTLQNLDIEEDKSVSQDSNRKLMCIIDNESNPVNTLVEGIKVSLEGNLEKKSSIDNQTHIYSKKAKIDSLPSYMLVQMVRFYWKQGAQGQEGTKAKILRQVTFPRILDLFDYCSERLQKNLQAGREYEKKKLLEGQKLEDDKFEQYKKTKGKDSGSDTREMYKKFKEEQKEEEIKKFNEQLYCKHGYGLETGGYQLIGVLSKKLLFKHYQIAHKGRLADSGHYVAWIHNSGESWFCYDDDKVSEVKTENILDLKGGGDWHMGYYLIYRKIELQ